MTDQNNPTGYQKSLKGLSIFLIVWAVLVLALAVFSVVAAVTPDLYAQFVTAENPGVALVGGVMALFGGLLILVVALLGLRGAKNPEKIGAFYWIALIGLVYNAVDAFVGLTEGGFTFDNVLSIAFLAICFYLAYRIKQQGSGIGRAA